jgi:hypothetical protein
VIKTDGAGNLSFVDISAVSGITGSGANTRLAVWSGTNSLTSDSSLTYNTTTDALYVGPVIFATGDTDTGIAFPGSDVIRLATGGTSRLGIANTEISLKVATTCEDSIELNSTLIDINGSAGTSGQILSSTGTGVDWIDDNSVKTTDTVWSFDADGAGTMQNVVSGDYVWFEGFNGITFGSQAGPGVFDHQVSASLDQTGVTAGSYYGSNITVDAYGRISAASNGSLTTVTKFSNIFTLNLNTNNNFLLNASGIYSIAMTITSANIGQSGAIIINNTAATTAGALPSYMLTPEGATLDWVNTSGAVSIISYFVIATDKVLCNYVANFQ